MVFPLCVAIDSNTKIHLARRYIVIGVSLQDEHGVHRTLLYIFKHIDTVSLEELSKENLDIEEEDVYFKYVVCRGWISDSVSEAEQ